MADRYPVTIEIGGEMLQMEFNLLLQLLEQLAPDDMEVDPQANIVAEIGEGTLAECGELTRFCIDHNIPYDVTTEAKYELDGQIEYWRPGMESPCTLLATQDGQEAVTWGELYAAVTGGLVITLSQFLARYSPPELPDLRIVEIRTPVEPAVMPSGSVAEVKREALKEAMRELCRAGLTQGDALGILHEENDKFPDAAAEAEADYAEDSSDDIEIDTKPLYSEGEGGIWVSAWLWVHCDDDDDEDDEDDDDEEGDDMCDLCMRSGLTIGRTTHSGKTVCNDCEDEADRLDAEYEVEHPEEFEDEEPETKAGD